LPRTTQRRCKRSGASRAFRCDFDALRRKGYKPMEEVAKVLRVSENTVRRMEAEA